MISDQHAQPPSESLAPSIGESFKTTSCTNCINKENVHKKRKQKKDLKETQINKCVAVILLTKVKEYTYYPLVVYFLLNPFQEEQQRHAEIVV